MRDDLPPTPVESERVNRASSCPRETDLMSVFYLDRAGIGSVTQICEARMIITGSCSELQARKATS